MTLLELNFNFILMLKMKSSRYRNKKPASKNRSGFNLKVYLKTVLITIFKGCTKDITKGRARVR